jgi:predicted CopG family antitoxin
MSKTIRVDADVYEALIAHRRPFPDDRNWSDVLRRLLRMPQPKQRAESK